MSSRRYSIDGNSVWFPSQFADDAIRVWYSRRGQAVEIWAIVGGKTTPTFRIPLNELLLALNVPRADQP